MQRSAGRRCVAAGLVLLATVLALSACSGDRTPVPGARTDVAEPASSPGSPSDPGATTPGSSGHAPVPSPSTHVDPRPSPPAVTSASPRGDDAPVVRQGQPIDVVDGDTFDLADGTRVRLAIVDTPELGSDGEPCAEEATDFAGGFLAGTTVAIHRPEDAPLHDDFDRLLGEVVRVSDGASLNVALVAAGLGRIDERFTDEDPDLTSRLRAAAADAPTPDCAHAGAASTEQQATGGQGSGGVTISDVRHDGPGSDMQYNDSEYVALSNDGGHAVDLSGWRVADDDGNSVTIGSGYHIDAGGTFRVYTGPGDNDPSSDRWYAGESQAYLNNSGGDDLRLVDATGTTVSTFRYES